MSQLQYDKLSEQFTAIIRQNVAPEVFQWLTEAAQKTASPPALYTAFALLPRKTGRQKIRDAEQQLEAVRALRPGLEISNWPVDRLSRVWLLMQMDASDENKYFQSIENLFRSAEVNELAALYSALPVLKHPGLWVARCAEGIRNNIGDVLEAIICHNPYPAENLPEPAWNQLVLKAFFTEKPVEQIVGLDERANEPLAATLCDYAQERWAARREVNPQIWRCVGKFIHERNFPDILKISSSANPLDREAAALACYDSAYPPARQLLNDELLEAIRTGKLSWNKLAEKTKEYVLQS